jgi:catechol 2,3-dioxygenase-like lactoylglutathione lyase family enzyme
MGLTSIDHVQLAMPAGGEPEAVAFYEGVLGLTQQQKPSHLAVRGGCWFGDGAVRIHLGVEADFRPARKAHPALRVEELDDVVARLEAAGHEVREEGGLDGFRQRYVDDPFGNRIELLEPVSPPAP